jgi:glutaredoxin
MLSIHLSLETPVFSAPKAKNQGLSVFAAAALASCLFLAACGDDEGNSAIRTQSTYDVIVYGVDGCGYTVRTLKSLDDEKIPYDYRDVDILEYKLEMWDKIRETAWWDSGVVWLPVIDIKGTVLERPSIDDIKSLLGDD